MLLSIREIVNEAIASDAVQKEWAYRNDNVRRALAEALELRLLERGSVSSVFYGPGPLYGEQEAEVAGRVRVTTGPTDIGVGLGDPIRPKSEPASIGEEIARLRLEVDAQLKTLNGLSIRLSKLQDRLRNAIGPDVEDRGYNSLRESL